MRACDYLLTENGDYGWDDQWVLSTSIPSKLAHIQFDTSVLALGDNTGFSAHTYTADAGNSTDATLASVSTPDVTLRDAGEYAVSWSIAMSAVSTSAASVLAIRLDGTQIAVATIGTTSSGTISLPNLYVPAAGSKLQFVINKITGGLHNVTGVVRITRLGG